MAASVSRCLNIVYVSENKLFVAVIHTVARRSAEKFNGVFLLHHFCIFSADYVNKLSFVTYFRFVTIGIPTVLL